MYFSHTVDLTFPMFAVNIVMFVAMSLLRLSSSYSNNSTVPHVMSALMKNKMIKRLFGFEDAIVASRECIFRE